MKTSMKNKTMNTVIIHRQRLRHRITAGCMAIFMLAQVCMPSVAVAAMLTSEAISSEVAADVQYQLSSSSSYQYQQASYLGQLNTIGNKTIGDFYQRLISSKVSLPAPTFVPIAGEVTFFIPTYPLGKLLGDSYVQNRFIRSQINNKINRHIIDIVKYPTEEAQINALYEEAYKFAVKTNGQYIFGQILPLGPDNISADMIWPEVHNINGEKVLVPVVYLSRNTIDNYGVKGHEILFAGSATFKDIELDKVNLLSARGDLIAASGNITLNGGKIDSTASLNLYAGGTLTNLSGRITAADNVTITAGQIINKTVVVPYTFKNGTGTRLGEIATIDTPNGNLSLRSYSDIIFEGAIASAAGTITFNADNNIVIGAQFLERQSTGKDGHWQLTSNSVDVVGSKIKATDTIRLMAGGAIQISGSDIHSTKGGVELLAKQGIYILDELGKTLVQKVDKIGKTQGTASDFNSWAIRSSLSAGKGVLLYTEAGDVTLKGANITSVDGAQVVAKNGKVHLLLSKERSEHYLNTVRKGSWTIKTTTVEQIRETGKPNAIVGGLAIEAAQGFDIEYTGKEGATLAEQMEEYRKIPEWKWMADLYDANYDQAKWEQVELAYKNLRETNRTLSPAAMAIIAIAVCVLTSGAGAGLIGATGGMSAAVANAAFTTLATQATQSLAAGNSLDKTFKAMGSDESLKALAVSMATAGAMQYTNVDFLAEAAANEDLAISLAAQAGQAVVDATVQAGITVTINGGSTDAFRQAFTQSLAASAVNSITKSLAQQIGISAHLPEGERISVGMKYIAHAAVGCLRGSLTSQINGSDAESACYSGAGGAVIGEAIGEHYAGKLDQELNEWGGEQLASTGNFPSDEQMFKQFEVFKAHGADMAQLSAAFVAFASGANGEDINIAGGAGMNAAQNNALNIATSIEKFRKMKEGFLNWWATPLENPLSQIGKDSRLYAMGLYAEVNRKYENGEITEAEYEYWSYVAEDRLAAAGVIPITNGDFVIFGLEVGGQLVGARYSYKTINGVPTLTEAADAALPPIGTLLEKRRRLEIFNQKLTAAPAAKNADEALLQLTKTMDEVEDAYSGIKKVENPGLKYEGRMYAPRSDYTIRNADGSVDAVTSGNIIKISPKGDITFHIKNSDGSAGKAVLFKAGSN